MFLLGILLLIGLAIAGALLYGETQRAQRELALRLEQLQAELAELRRQAAAPAPASPVPAASNLPAPQALSPPLPVAPPSTPEPVTDEQTIAMLAAVIAAHLGKRVRIRRARLLPTVPTAWAQQGRVIIQASHSFQRGGHR